MGDITYLDEPIVELVDSMGSDDSIVRAARVSVVGANDPDDIETRRPGLIKYLMEHRHGSPFEHTSMTFYVAAPIFVFREFHRHRIGFSYNEMSGRYTDLPGDFYVPASDRPLINVGTSSRPEFVAGTPEQYDVVTAELAATYEQAWASYRRMLHQGIANEVARTVLPVGIFSQMYVTTNARALMNFLSLRVDSPDATIRSRPQYEIQQVAKKMERIFEERFPLVHAAFVKNGRQAP